MLIDSYSSHVPVISKAAKLVFGSGIMGEQLIYSLSGVSFAIGSIIVALPSWASSTFLIRVISPKYEYPLLISS
jgi:hypothetical protein